MKVGLVSFCDLRCRRRVLLFDLNFESPTILNEPNEYQWHNIAFSTVPEITLTTLTLLIRARQLADHKHGSGPAVAAHCQSSRSATPTTIVNDDAPSQTVAN